MFYQIFLSPQLKRCGIITYKRGTYKLPHELPNDLRLKKLGHIRKVSKFHGMIAQYPIYFANTSKKILEKQKIKHFSQRSALFHMKTRVNLRYFDIDCNHFVDISDTLLARNSVKTVCVRRISLPENWVKLTCSKQYLSIYFFMIFGYGINYGMDIW